MTENGVKKRKTHTSTAVKQRYIDKVYDSVRVRVPKDVAAAFKTKCAERGVTQAQVIKDAIERFLAESQQEGALFLCGSNALFFHPQNRKQSPLSLI